MGELWARLGAVSAEREALQRSASAAEQRLTDLQQHQGSPSGGALHLCCSRHLHCAQQPAGSNEWTAAGCRAAGLLPLHLLSDNLMEIAVQEKQVGHSSCSEDSDRGGRPDNA